MNTGTRFFLGRFFGYYLYGFGLLSGINYFWSELTPENIFIKAMSVLFFGVGTLLLAKTDEVKKI